METHIVVITQESKVKQWEGIATRIITDQNFFPKLSQQ
jgi:hypothetical protein